MTLQNVFRAIADPTRRDILVMLSRKDMTIGEVSDQFSITRAAVKKHLRILEEGDLISVEIQGRSRINHLQTAPLKEANQWINYFSQFWDDRLEALGNALQADLNSNKIKDTKK